jgi:hypothetical protein
MIKEKNEAQEVAETQQEKPKATLTAEELLGQREVMEDRKDKIIAELNATVGAIRFIDSIMMKLAKKNAEQ